jgi:hypothetical protein
MSRRPNIPHEIIIGIEFIGIEFAQIYFENRRAIGIGWMRCHEYMPWAGIQPRLL